MGHQLLGQPLAIHRMTSSCRLLTRLTMNPPSRRTLKLVSISVVEIHESL